MQVWSGTTKLVIDWPLALGHWFGSEITMNEHFLDHNMEWAGEPNNFSSAFHLKKLQFRISRVEQPIQNTTIPSVLTYSQGLLKKPSNKTNDTAPADGIKLDGDNYDGEKPHALFFRKHNINISIVNINYWNIEVVKTMRSVTQERGEKPPDA